jgi:protocatechuate 3,4-dioxygenase beta subunit
MQHAVRILICVLVCLLAGMVPGTQLVHVIAPIQQKAPDVPDSHGPRDARLDVVVTSSAGNHVQSATIDAYLMIAGRAYHAETARTDASGVGRLTAMPRGEHYLVIDAKGFARKSTMVVLEPGARRLDVELALEQTLDVTVVDESHAPVENAEVEVSAGDPVPVGARTGSDGKVHVTSLGAGPYRVRAQAKGFDPQIKGGVSQGTVCELMLVRLAALDVTVLSAGDKPAAHATVSIAGASLYPSRAAEADAAGHVRIAGLSAGSYALRGRLGGEISPTELSVSLGRGEVKAITLRLGQGASLLVIVTDSDGDLPLNAARVTLAEGGLSPFPLEAVTNKEGHAVIGPWSPGRAVVTVQKDGYVASPSLPVPDDGSPLHVSLGRGAKIEGRIVDGRGFPIDGATFVVVGTDTSGGPIDDDPRTRSFTSAHFTARLGGPSPLLPAGELGVVPGPVPPIPHGESAGLSLVPQAPVPGVVPDEPWVSKRDGTFSLSPVTPGRVRVLARHPEYTDVFGEVLSLAPSTVGHADLVMRRGGSIEGRVTDPRGRPVAGMEVTALATHGSMERGARTASDGTFAFAAMPETVTLLVSDPADPGEPLARVMVDVQEGKRTEVTVPLPEPRAALSVRVTDSRGHGLSSAIVTAASADEKVALHATGFADENGELTIPRGQGVSLRLDVRAPSYASRRVLVDPRKEPLKLTMESQVLVVGVAETSRGEPIVGAEITAFADVGALHAQTDKDGAFRFNELGAGTVRFGARKAGHAPVEVEAQVASTRADRPFTLPKLVMPEEGVVTGLVVDENGKPVQGARIAKDSVSTYLAVGAGGQSAFAVSARDGTFRLGELPGGDLTLEALLSDVGRGTVTAHVDAGRTTRDVKLVVTRTTETGSGEHAAGGVAVTLGETAEPVEVVVVAVASGSEAERAGLLPHDVLLEVDGHSTASMKDARRRLSGPLADEVVLRIRRGDDPRVLRFPREAVRK